MKTVGIYLGSNAIPDDFATIFIQHTKWLNFHDRHLLPNCGILPFKKFLILFKIYVMTINDSLDDSWLWLSFQKCT